MTKSVAKQQLSRKVRDQAMEVGGRRIEPRPRKIAALTSSAGAAVRRAARRHMPAEAPTDQAHHALKAATPAPELHFPSPFSPNLIPTTSVPVRRHEDPLHGRKRPIPTGDVLPLLTSYV